ncbi:epoxyqueuosine reductase QueH [Candidatus Saccharibacteria bacterium]|nr:epoxyqueuosine reductase QueH [Candidatus Saccharibacteria bacterium]
MKLLLHTCCAPCSVYPVKTLRKEGIEPTLFWYNPNIHPMNEYILRRDCLVERAKSENLKLIIEDEYGLDDFVCNVNKSTLNDLSKRCETYCYPLRFRKVFEYAKANGFDTVSTTLLYSIYQKHDYIAKLMEELSKEYGINFLYRDFREGWREGQDEARAAGLYMQKYCGCVYSEEESTFARKNKKLFKELDLKPTNENARKLIEKNS